MQRIVPNIWCQRNAVEVGDFYAQVLPNASSTVSSSYPTEGLLDFQVPFAGLPLVVDVNVDGYQLRLINAGEEFWPTPAISFILNMDPLKFDGGEAEARERINSMWAAFSDGGTVRMELGEYPYSKLYGWIEDRYGVNWQLMLTDPEGPPAPLVVPSLLFTGAEAKAQAAMDFYTDLIPGSSVDAAVPYPEGDDSPEGVMFAQFTLAEQCFSTMDGGTDHKFTFSPGISLEISCPDQAEIDRLWDALSSVPEAEACGWVQDRYGVSWQIVPANMDALMKHPGAYERMIQMKKLIIADL